MNEESNVELETLIMIAAYFLVEKKGRKIKDMEDDFLFDLQFKLAECCEHIKGTLH